jgi:hypothetical protein
MAKNITVLIMLEPSQNILPEDADRARTVRGDIITADMITEDIADNIDGVWRLKTDILELRFAYLHVTNIPDIYADNMRELEVPVEFGVEVTDEYETSISTQIIFNHKYNFDIFLLEDSLFKDIFTHKEITLHFNDFYPKVINKLERRSLELSDMETI